MRITIKITKEVLKKTSRCGSNNITKNCAISVAVRDLFGDVEVSNISINDVSRGIYIKLPDEAKAFTMDFDSSTVEQRLLMPELSFEIDVPNSVIDQVGIGQVYKVLSESKTLELVL